MFISYNLLNLPTRLFCWGDYAEYYDYLADGTKVRHAYQDGQERIYAGSLVYDQGVFESAAFGGGRIVGTYDDSEAHYFLTDHLGSTRVVARVTPTGREDLDRKDYYPFGKAWTQADMPTSGNRYTFSGKEQVDVAIEDGIATPIHDFGARYYDPDGVLFFQQDPLMEKYYSIGQYNYCMGNPVRMIDADGRIPLDTVWDALNVIYDIGAAVANHIAGDHQAAKSHWVDLGADVAALMIPYVPAGASKLAKGADKAVDAVKATAKTGESSLDAMRRGVESEKRVLMDMGLEKNTQRLKVEKDGVERTVIPDAVDANTVYEIKDAKRVSNTKQIRAERQKAKEEGKKFRIITGERTHVSSKIPEEEIIRRKDLGPQ